jgi:uncharacterized cysteine cluster protein YcgN (CxxCxxCC family)
MNEAPFWTTRTLDQMSRAEWESLCDGCGRCCLIKLEDEDSGEIHATDVGCKLFDAASCRCKDYPNRARKVPDCVTLTPQAARDLRWLPPTCAYRLLAAGEDLPWWHPLVSGDPQTVIDAGVSVKGRVFASEDEVLVENLMDRIRPWPLRWPEAARRPPAPAPAAAPAPFDERNGGRNGAHGQAGD